MHFTILSRSSAIYTTRRLADATRMAGHRARVLDPLRCEMLLSEGKSGLLYRRKPIGRTDACIPRIGQSIQNYGLVVVDQFEQEQVPVLNGAAAIARSRNKIRCLQHLASHAIPVPATVMANDAGDIKSMVELIGGVPVLLKLLQGADKVGVMVCETHNSLQAALEALLGLGHNVIVQQYVREAKGRDIRAFVVGGRAIAAVRRVPRVGRLRRTLGAGARIQATRLPPDFAAMAERAAQLVGLDVAAVDMLDLAGGPRVFEVNSSPGIKEIEEATGIDLAAAIVERAAERVREARSQARSAESKAPPAGSQKPAARKVAKRS